MEQPTICIIFPIISLRKPPGGILICVVFTVAFIPLRGLPKKAGRDTVVKTTLEAAIQVNPIAAHELTPGKTSAASSLATGGGEKPGEIRDYFGQSLFAERTPTDGMLLYPCASPNINKKGSMVSYGVPRHDP